ARSIVDNFRLKFSAAYGSDQGVPRARAGWVRWRMAPTPTPPAGWYVDLDDPGRLRWWDGRHWSDHVALGGQVLPQPVPIGTAAGASRRPAWLPDPVDASRLRWWDGAAW